MNKSIRKPGTHTSLDRPTARRLGGLPATAELHRTRTPWQMLVSEAHKHAGDWFQLERTYTSVHSAITSARKAAEEEFDADTVERLQFASEPVPAASGERVVVYLRFLPAPSNAPVDASERFAEADDVGEFLAHGDPQDVEAYLAVGGGSEA